MLWVLGLALGYLAACWVLARWYVGPRHYRVPFSLPDTAHLDIPGPGYVLPIVANRALIEDRSTSEAVFVLMHGFGGSQHSWQDIASRLLKRGYDVVVPALRAHGPNPCPSRGFGPAESEEVLAGVRWVRARRSQGPRPKVVVVGLSLGGSAAWLASQKAPDQIDAVVSDGAFARLDQATDRWFSLILPGGPWVLRPVVWMAGWMTGVRPSDVRPIDAAARWKGKPCLVIHAGQDRLIERSHAEALSQAAGCPIWDVPEATHTQCKKADPEGYVRRLVGLLSDD